jgi:hypothetical protein
MPSAAYYRRRARSLRSLAQIDLDPAESRRYQAMAVDCMTKAREMELDEFQLRIMPIRKAWRPPRKSGKRTKAASTGGLVVEKPE